MNYECKQIEFTFCSGTEQFRLKLVDEGCGLFHIIDTQEECTFDPGELEKIIAKCYEQAENWRVKEEESIEQSYAAWVST